MLLASLENEDRIEIRHWARAQRIAESWRQNLHWLYDDITGNEQSRGKDIEEKIQAHIGASGPLTKREVCQKTGLDSVTAGIYLESMAKANLLDVLSSGRTTKYVLSG